MADPGGCQKRERIAEKEGRNYLIAAGKVIVIPTPTADPCSATIVGLWHLCIANATRPPLPGDEPSQPILYDRDLSWEDAYISRKSTALPPPSPNPISRSDPAQNILPVPVSTTAFTRGSM